MSEQNKDNISQFFRKAVQKPKISFEESDWDKLEARLDAASKAGASKPNHWRTAFIAAAALLFVSTSLLLYTSRQVSTLTKKTKNDEIKVNGIASSSAPASSKNEKSTAEQQEQKNVKENKPDETANHSSLLPNATRKEASTLSGKNFSEAGEQNPTSLQSAEAKNKELIQNDGLNNNISTQNVVTLDKESKAVVVNSSSNGELTGSPQPRDSSSVEKQINIVVDCGVENVCDSLAETIKSRPSRWNVMLSLSPDFSSTDLNKFSTPGGAFGIAAYYAINNRFSVSAGVVKSSKYYWDDGYEYQPVQSGFWAKKTNGIVPSEIDGSCSVLEIPLGLQYYAMSTKKNKLYVASTFSSYIMLRESYQYIFDAPNPGAAESWNAKKVSYNLFSVANFAVGYERSISNRLMIGVAPYLKIPLSGIGAWANVKLYSTGASFTLRYQFHKKKKPDRLIPAD